MLAAIFLPSSGIRWVSFSLTAVAVFWSSFVLPVSSETVCPPPGFDSAPDFNLAQYVAAPWYVQQQMINSYQPENDLYCVRAKYTPLDTNNFTAGIIVSNYRNQGGVNQNPGGSSGAGGSNCSAFDQLRAFPAKPAGGSPTDASKLLVGPQPIAAQGRPELLGNYWVLAVGASQNASLGYDWAIISAGPPSVVSNGACRSGTVEQQRDPRAMNGVGLWLFSRIPEDPTNTETMRQKAKDLGFDLSVLVPVQQQGCKYIQADTTCSALSTQP